jgi:signal transduction histidine kinase
LLYAVIAGAWIAFSDRILAGLIQDHTLFTNWQTAKGWLFVAVMALILYAERARAEHIFVNDVAERKRVEEALRKSEETYRTLAAQVRQQLDMLNTLYAGARELTTSLDTHTLAESVTRACVQNFGAKMAWLGRAEPDGMMQPLSHFPAHSDYLRRITVRRDESPEGQGPTGHAIRTGAPVILDDVLSDTSFAPWHAAAQEAGIVTSAALPLISQKEAFGSLNLYSDQPGFFSPERVAFFQAYAHQTAIALANARLYEEVREGRERLRALSRQLIEAQETERRSLARELHDEIGQVLTAVKTNLQTIQLAPEPAVLASRLKESLGIVDRALRQVRDLSLNLRPSLLDDFGLVAALEWYVDRQAERSGCAIEFVSDLPDTRYAPDIETACFRVAQAALTNVTRHAQASHVRVEVRESSSASGRELLLIVRDDGAGFDVRSALERAVRGDSMGLLGMQERLALVGGQLDIDSAPGYGTDIRARFQV